MEFSRKYSSRLLQRNPETVFFQKRAEQLFVMNNPNFPSVNAATDPFSVKQCERVSENRPKPPEYSCNPAQSSWCMTLSRTNFTAQFLSPNVYHSPIQFQQPICVISLHLWYQTDTLQLQAHHGLPKISGFICKIIYFMFLSKRFALVTNIKYVYNIA